MSKVHTMLVAAGICLALTATADPQTDAFFGIWQMNMHRSHYASGNLPLSMTIVMRPAQTGIYYRSQTVRTDRRLTTAQYEAGYDGRLALVAGDTGLMIPVALRRIDDRTIEARYVRGFVTQARSTLAVSADGCTLTVKTTAVQGDGHEGLNEGVYERADLRDHAMCLTPRISDR
jgi:hypothetical protein